MDQPISLDSVNRLLWPQTSRFTRHAPSEPEEQDHAQLLREISHHVEVQTSFRKRMTHRGTRKAYRKAERVLESMRSATERFLQDLVDQSFDFSQFFAREHATHEIRQVMRDLLGDAYYHRFTRPRSVMSLPLLAGSNEDLYEKLRTHQRRATQTFLSEFTGIIERLAETGLLGSLRYAPCNTHCEFSYFRSKALANPPNERRRRRRRKSEKVISETLSEPYFERNGWWRTRTTSVRVLNSGVATIRHVRNKHLLSDALTVPLAHWRLPLPPRIKSVKETLPEFLRPFAWVVAGTMEHGLIIESDVAEAPYSYSEVKTRTETVRHEDPALVLAPNGDAASSLVLSGWCPDEEPDSRLLIRGVAAISHRFHQRRRFE